MWKKVQNYIDEYEMLGAGERVVVALSGGADSVCLLLVLHRLQERYQGLELRAVHVHHGLRGDEADRDVRFVQNLCDSLQISLTVVYRDVAAYAKEHGLSEEEAGRMLRYEAFAQEIRRWEQEVEEKESAEDIIVMQEKRMVVALAHHKDDNAETILHHLLRGSGLKGLSGIRPVQGNRIRPLLCVGRREILEYLEKEGISWCEDSSNKSSDYTRNRIRNQILPMMTEQINRNAAENILHASAIIAQADQYLEKQAMQVWKQAGSTYTRRNGSLGTAVCIKRSVFCAQDSILQTYLVRHMLDQVVPGWKDITSNHFYQIAELAGKQSGKRLNLPGGVLAFCEYEDLILKNCERCKKTDAFVCERLTLPKPDGEMIWVQGLKMRSFSIKKGEEIPKNQYTKWFDYDKIKNTLFLRTRQSGDYLMLPGGGKKAITRYMIDEKIPREQRERIPVLAEEAHVLWVIGFRISEYYKVTNTTKTILEVEFDGGRFDGRESASITV